MTAYFLLLLISFLAATILPLSSELALASLLNTGKYNSFVLIGDKKNNIYLANVKKISKNNISKNSQEFLNYKKQANIKIRDTVYKTYDYYIAQKYKVKINEKTLERVKNYFK